MPVDPRVKFLRINETHTERLLWAQLRKKRVENMRFRRQYPIGSYVVDFVSLPARLVVEIDGPSHDLTAQNDERRTAWLRSQNFRVIRFSNHDVMTNLEGVVKTIELEVARAAPVVTPPPTPSRKGRGD